MYTTRSGLAPSFPCNPNQNLAPALSAFSYAPSHPRTGDEVPVHAGTGCHHRDTLNPLSPAPLT
jgi:hypothetical protein